MFVVLLSVWFGHKERNLNLFHTFASCIWINASRLLRHMKLNVIVNWCVGWGLCICCKFSGLTCCVGCVLWVFLFSLIALFHFCQLWPEKTGICSFPVFFCFCSAFDWTLFWTVIPDFTDTLWSVSEQTVLPPFVKGFVIYFFIKKWFRMLYFSCTLSCFEFSLNKKHQCLL